jgi:protein AIR1/2
MTKDQIHHTAKFSEDSETGEASEGDDAIVLNMDTPSQPGVLEGSSKESIAALHEDPLRSVPGSSSGLQSISAIANGPSESAPKKTNSQGADTGSEKHMFAADVSPHYCPEGSKEAAFRSFTLKYDPKPVTLADLSPEDLELQIKYFFYDLSSKDLDLSFPVRCIDCMKEGHLPEICPGKEVRTFADYDPLSCQFG